MVSHLYIFRRTMAIIVDKVQKRKDIALSCKEIFFQNGINDLTISQIAKSAGVGKGTIYEYFKNKEDIIFEIVNILVKERNIITKQKLDALSTTKEKVKLFSRFFYSDEDIELRQLYKEFISISLVNPDSEMLSFQTACSKEYYTWFESIIQEGITKGELKENAKEFTKGLFSVGEGMFIKSSVTHIVDDLEKELHQFYDSMFTMLEIQK